MYILNGMGTEFINSTDVESFFLDAAPDGVFVMARLYGDEHRKVRLAKFPNMAKACYVLRGMMDGLVNDTDICTFDTSLTWQDVPSEAAEPPRKVGFWPEQGGTLNA